MYNCPRNKKNISQKKKITTKTTSLWVRYKIPEWKENNHTKEKLKRSTCTEEKEAHGLIRESIVFLSSDQGLMHVL